MEAEAAEEERRWKEWEAVVGVAEVEVDAGSEVEEAREDGEIDGEGAEEEAADGKGFASKLEEDGAVDRKGVNKKKKQQQQQPRTPGSAGSRASWKGRGGWGKGGFHHRPWNLQHHKLSIFKKPGVYGGAIILCNHVIKRECFQQKMFGLPGYAATFIRRIRAGMLLFVFEREERKLHGVFEATSDGALNILPNAFPSLQKFRPAQVRFRRVWFCKPLNEAEFSGFIKGIQPQMSFFGISYEQVLNLVHLFSSKRIGLQAYQKPKSKVLWDYNISLAHSGLQSTLHTHSNACPMFCNNRFSLPHSSFMYTKQNAKHTAYKYESPLCPQLKSVIFKEPDIQEKGLEPNADYIPLELDDPDDCNSDGDTVLSDMSGTVSLYSTLVGSINYEDQDPKPYNGKHNEDDVYPSPVLNQRFISENETGRISAIAHIMKKRQSSMQGKGCKLKVILQSDEHSDLSTPSSCSMENKVSFSVSSDEISVTSDKALHRPALSELEHNREAFIKERKQEVEFSVHDIQSKGEDCSAKRSKLMSLPFPERHANQRVQSCSMNSRSLMGQSGTKLTCNTSR